MVASDLSQLTSTHWPQVADVEVLSIGGTAISIAGGDRPTLTPGHHSVTNCSIHDYARVLPAADITATLASQCLTMWRLL